MANVKQRVRAKDVSSHERMPDPGRHAAQCSICVHALREEMDREFLNWGSPSQMATAYSVSRDAIYRHAHATGLLPKRQRNVRAALEKIIEKASEVEVNAAAVVNAVSAYSRINSRGQWIERSEGLDLNQLFERMTRAEMEAYAREGILRRGLGMWWMQQHLTVERQKVRFKSLITRREGSHQVATNPELRPGDFPLGSLESRAAARMMLNHFGGITHVVSTTGLPRPGSTYHSPA